MLLQGVVDQVRRPAACTVENYAATITDKRRLFLGGRLHGTSPRGPAFANHKNFSRPGYDIFSTNN